MYLSELLHAAGRRWYVLIAGLILTGFLVVLAVRMVPITYDAQSSVLLLPPSISVEETKNPFLDLGGLEVVAGVLTRSLTDSQSVESVAPPSGTAEYTVDKDQQVSGSVLQISATDVTPTGAFSTLSEVVDLATVRLKSLQDTVGAPEASQVRLMVITNNTEAVPNFGSLVRLVIVVTAAGLIATLLLALFVDAVARRRRFLTASRSLDPTEQAPESDEAKSLGAGSPTAAVSAFRVDSQ